MKATLLTKERPTPIKFGGCNEFLNKLDFLPVVVTNAVTCRRSGEHRIYIYYFGKEMPDKILLRDEFAVRCNADCQRGEKK